MRPRPSRKVGGHLWILVALVCLSGCVGANGLSPVGVAPEELERVLAEAPVVSAVFPSSSFTREADDTITGIHVEVHGGCGTLIGPQALLLTSHQGDPYKGDMLVNGERTHYRVERTVKGPTSEWGDMGWRLLRLSEPVQGLGAVETDFQMPLPEGEIVFSVYVEPLDSAERLGAAAFFTPKDGRIELKFRSRIVPLRVLQKKPPWLRRGIRDDPERAEILSELLVLSGGELPKGASGGPVLWWPAERTKPVCIGINVGGMTFRDQRTNEELGSVVLARRPHELSSGWNRLETE